MVSEVYHTGGNVLCRKQRSARTAPSSGYKAALLKPGISDQPTPDDYRTSCNCEARRWYRMEKHFEFMVIRVGDLDLNFAEALLNHVQKEFALLVG